MTSIDGYLPFWPPAYVTAIVLQLCVVVMAK